MYANNTSMGHFEFQLKIHVTYCQNIKTWVKKRHTNLNEKNEQRFTAISIVGESRAECDDANGKEKKKREKLSIRVGFVFGKFQWIENE